MDHLFDKLPYDLLRKLSLSQLLGGAFGLGLALYVAFHLTLYSSMQDELTSIQNKRDQVNNTLKRYHALLGQKETINAELVVARGELAQLKRQMPRKEDMLDFIKQVAEIGETMGVEILLIKLQPEVEKDFFREIPVKIEIRGGFYKTAGFLKAIQNLLRLVDITHLKMRTKSFEIPLGRGESRVKTMLLTSSVTVAYSYIEGSEDRAPTKEKET